MNSKKKKNNGDDDINIVCEYCGASDLYPDEGGTEWAELTSESTGICTACKEVIDKRNDDNAKS